MVFNTMMRNKEEVLKMLFTLDYYCKREGIKAEIIMLGGSAILTLMELRNKSFRPTSDIDINIIKVNNFERFNEQLKKINIHIVGGVIEVPPPEDFEETKNRHEIEMGFESIRVFVPNLELLACSKIFSMRGKDLDDLKHTQILENCNKRKLFGMVEEYKKNLLNPSNPNLNIHELDRILEEKGIQYN